MAAAAAASASEDERLLLCFLRGEAGGMERELRLSTMIAIYTHTILSRIAHVSHSFLPLLFQRDDGLMRASCTAENLRSPSVVNPARISTVMNSASNAVNNNNTGLVNDDEEINTDYAESDVMLGGGSNSSGRGSDTNGGILNGNGGSQQQQQQQRY